VVVHGTGWLHVSHPSVGPISIAVVLDPSFTLSPMSIKRNGRVVVDHSIGLGRVRDQLVRADRVLDSAAASMDRPLPRCLFPATVYNRENFGLAKALARYPHTEPVTMAVLRLTTMDVTSCQFPSVYFSSSSFVSTCAFNRISAWFH
jgi:hypothetical protein